MEDHAPGMKTHDARRGPSCGCHHTDEIVKHEQVAVGAALDASETVGGIIMHVRVTDLVPGDRIKVVFVAIVDRYEERGGTPGYHCHREDHNNCCWLSSDYIRTDGRYWDVITKTWLRFS